jgi:hypothetical protein
VRRRRSPLGPLAVLVVLAGAAYGIYRTRPELLLLDALRSARHEGPAPAAGAAAPADALLASSDFTVAIPALASMARGLRTSADPPKRYGDLVTVVGTDAPMMSINLARRLGLPHDRWLILFYGPRVRGVNRLDQFEVVFAPAPPEGRVLAWLGPPLRSEDEGGGRRKLVYGRRDQAGLRVWSVSWDPLAEQYDTRRLRVRIDGRG